MSARLAACFAQLKSEGRAGLVAYVMASDPDLETSFEILRALPAAGADIIELGFPFTDPMADGPSIQRAAERALLAGGSLRSTIALVERFRRENVDTPIVLMGYANPLESMGHAAFSQAAAAAGVDGAIIVDVPPEEDAPLRAALDGQSVALIRLATPTTDDSRLQVVLRGVGGFVYYVAVAGVTGQKAAAAEDIDQAVSRLKRATDLPIAVGFGVREPEQAKRIAKVADAVVVGSGFVDEITRALDENAGENVVERVATKVKLLSAAVRGARLA